MMAPDIDSYNSASALGDAAEAAAILATPPPVLPTNWEWTDTDGLCGWIGITPRQLYHLRAKREGPLAHRVGKQLRFRRADVESWLKSRQAAGPA
jgi:predicted DNA-binding transcriptional regulator AlpA